MGLLSWLVIRTLIQHYLQTFSNFDLYQFNEQSTRNGKIIDLICTNIPEKGICRDVMSCSSISDHDAPYMVTNIPSANISHVLKTWKTLKWTKLYLISSTSLYKVVRWTLFISRSKNVNRFINSCWRYFMCDYLLHSHYSL